MAIFSLSMNMVASMKAKPLKMASTAGADTPMVMDIATSAGGRTTSYMATQEFT